MSQTITTTAPRQAGLENVLEDYTIRLSGVASDPEPEPTAAEREARGREESLAASNPATWPTDYRRVPNYRPINRFLDPEQRPNGANTAEYIFVNVMLNGVRLQSQLVTLYESTGGNIWRGLARYEIGGEW